MYTGKKYRKSMWIYLISCIQKELNDILRIGCNLHFYLVNKMREYFMVSLEHFNMLNTCYTRIDLVMPILTVENIGMTGRTRYQFDNQCGSFCESVEYSSGAYSDYINKSGPYLMVAWNRVLISLYADIFRLLNVLDICMVLFV